MSRWLSIVGIGDDGLDGLTAAARTLVDQAEVLVGGDRHLAMLPADGRERMSWPKPFDPTLATLKAYRGRPVCVLASGDPSCYGVGSLIAAQLGAEEMRIVPAPSAYSLACARLGWNLAEVETLSLHARPLELLHPFIQPQARLLVLSRDGDTPRQIAGLLCERDYGRSRVSVLEHMGGCEERVVSGAAASWDEKPSADLNTVAIECVADAGAALLPRVAGLPDDVFEHDGQLTKREVRAVTLAVLAPVAGQTLWDIGAGCGSVSIEWMRAARGARAIAIEENSERCRMIASNAQALGTPGLDIVSGRAPGSLRELPSPDAVFIGGGATREGLFDTCWAALDGGGRLVANGVTVEGEQALAEWRRKVGGSLVRLSIARAAPVGRFLGWRPSMPVTQFAATKHE